MKLTLKMTFIIISCALLSACGLFKPNLEQPQKVTLNVQTTTDVNQDILGQAAPIALTFYQLTDQKHFSQADFSDLKTNVTKTLADTLLNQKTVVIPAGVSEKIALTLQPGCEVLGVIAAYRDLQHKTWRTTISCGALRSGLKIQVDSHQLLLEKKWSLL